MTTLEDLERKPYDERTPLEHMIVSARFGRWLQELAVAELDHIRARRLEGVSAYDIANSITDELFIDGGLHKEAIRLGLVHRGQEFKGAEWGKIPARNIILKHIRAALDKLK